MKRRVAATGLFLRTVRNLRPRQVFARIRLRTMKQLLARRPSWFERRWETTVGASVGWPQGYVPLDGRGDRPSGEAGAVSRGEFTFLDERRDLGDPMDWAQAEAAQLWRYHLHYFEWAWALAGAIEREGARSTFGRLWTAWRSGTAFGRWDEWSPYVVSVRTWALCGLYEPLVRGTAHEADYVRSIALHAGFVARNLEFDVGGNHLLKNIKALIGAGVFLDDARLVGRGTSLLARELQVQVLHDGGHFERSPTYHCQVLGDLIDVQELLREAAAGEVAGLADAVEAMRSWLGEMLMPDGDVPLFNDAVPVGPSRIALLEPRPPSVDRVKVLEPSGYVIVRADPAVRLVLDVGLPCPPELPAHAHADCLSFELSYAGRRLVVDSGTSTYDAGPRRRYERSTRAHNTLEVDGEDQTEVWGQFRAGRLARPFLEEVRATDGVVSITASHDGYARLPGRPVHRRRIELRHDALEVTDLVTGTGRHGATARLHLAPGEGAEWTSDGIACRPSGVIILTDPGGESELEPCEIASGFSRLDRAAAVVTRAVGELPLQLTTVMHFGGDEGGSS